MLYYTINIGVFIIFTRYYKYGHIYYYFYFEFGKNSWKIFRAEYKRLVNYLLLPEETYGDLNTFRFITLKLNRHTIYSSFNNEIVFMCTDDLLANFSILFWSFLALMGQNVSKQLKTFLRIFFSINIFLFLVTNLNFWEPRCGEVSILR